MPRFLIAPFDSGLVKEQAPWLVPESAFTEFNNAYIYKGKIKKRIGSKYMGVPDTQETAQLSSRLRIKLGITDAGTGILNGTIPDGGYLSVGQMFSIEEVMLTVTNNGAGLLDMLNTDAAAITHARYNYATGGYEITAIGAYKGKNVYFYPGEPVLGLTQYEDGTREEEISVAFDTRFSYKFDGNSWDFLDAAVGTTTWNSGSYDYFWMTNYAGTNPEDTALFVCNFNLDAGVIDPIRYWNGLAWTSWTPKFLTAGGAAINAVLSAKIMLPFKGFFVFFNTYEERGGTNHYQNRCRFSWYGSPIDPTAWLEPKQTGAGGGGFIDAPTEEAIVSVEFIRDRLIVFFEKSIWELVYTGNPVLPFVWQKINTELGSIGTFSSVPFDDVVLNIGQTGIIACSGAAVQRIDNAIPHEILKTLRDSDQVKRIHGVRDYKTELVYWSLPMIVANDTDAYPDRILVYNYKNNTWSYFDDSITTFGYCQQSTGNTWEHDFSMWKEDLSSWDSDLEIPYAKQLIGGNQQGYTFFINRDEMANASALQVTKIDTTDFTVINHNLKEGDFLALNNCNAGIDIGLVQSVVNNNTIKIWAKVGDDWVYADNAAYLGGGTLERISRISIKSKQLNPFIKQGKGLSLDKINFCVKKTTNGEITVDYNVSNSGLDFISEATVSGSQLGTNVLETSPYVLKPIEEEADRFWHPVYFSADGEFAQIHIYHTDEQLLEGQSYINFTLEGMLLHVSPRGDI